MHHVMGFKEMKLLFHKSIRSFEVHHNNFQFQRNLLTVESSPRYIKKSIWKRKKINVSFDGSQCQSEFSQNDKILSK